MKATLSESSLLPKFEEAPWTFMESIQLPLNGEESLQQTSRKRWEHSISRGSRSIDRELRFSSDAAAFIILTTLVNSIVMVSSALSQPVYQNSISIRDSNFLYRSSMMHQRWMEYRDGLAFDLADATRFVNEQTRHVERREIRFYENWIQWAVGYFYPPAREVQNTSRLMSGGFASCSQRAQILKSFAEAAGLQCRFVGLDGHVVLEVEVDGSWKLADPDYGIAYDCDLTELERPESESLIRSKLASMRLTPKSANNYVQIIQSSENNVRLPIGAQLSPRLHLVETLCNWLIWLTPIPFFILLRIAGFRFS